MSHQGMFEYMFQYGVSKYVPARNVQMYVPIRSVEMFQQGLFINRCTNKVCFLTATSNLHKKGFNSA